MKPKQLIISPCELNEVRDFIEKNHYSHNVNGVKVTQCFSIKHGEELVGGALFGQMSTTAWKKFGDSEKEVLELRRLVLCDSAERNSESYVVGWCLRWIKKNISEVKIIVSYADPKYNHSGTIYKASNFKFVGESGKDNGFVDSITGKVYHSRSLRTKYKGEYKPYVKVLREKLEKGILIPIELPRKLCFTYQFR